MSFNIHFTLYVAGDSLPVDVTVELLKRDIAPKGAANRLGSGPLSHTVELSYDLFDGPVEALQVYGWTNVADSTYWVSPDGLLFTVRFF